MTRKNYIGIAGAVSDALYHITHGLVMPNTAEERRARRLGLETVILMLCKELQADNDRFDAERFTEACGLHDTKHGLIVRYAKRHGVEVPNEQSEEPPERALKELNAGHNDSTQSGGCKYITMHNFEEYMEDRRFNAVEYKRMAWLQIIALAIFDAWFAIPAIVEYIFQLGQYADRVGANALALMYQGIRRL